MAGEAARPRARHFRSIEPGESSPAGPHTPGGWWERPGWAGGTALGGSLSPVGAVTVPQRLQAKGGGEEEATGQSPPAVTALRMRGQARQLLQERGREPEVRGACRRRSRASPGQGRRRGDALQAPGPGAIFHPLSTICHELASEQRALVLHTVPARGPTASSSHAGPRPPLSGPGGGSGKAEAYGGTQRVGGGTESSLPPLSVPEPHPPSYHQWGNRGPELSSID